MEGCGGANHKQQHSHAGSMSVASMYTREYTGKQIGEAFVLRLIKPCL